MNNTQLDLLKKKYEELKNKSTGGTNNDWQETYLSVAEGPEGTAVRIIPSFDPNKLFYVESAVHRVDDKNYHCLREQDQKCPICEVYFALWKTNNEANIAVARSIKPRKKFYMNVLERSTGKVKILVAGIKLITQIVAIIHDADYGDITDPETGHDYRIIMKKISGFNNYDESRPKPTKTKLADSELEFQRIKDASHDLSSLVKYPTYEELEEKAALVLSTCGSKASDDAIVLLD